MSSPSRGDPPLGKRIEPKQQPDERGLAGTRRSDDAHRLPGGNRHAHIAQHEALWLVAKGEVLEGKIAPGAADLGHRLLRLLLGLQNVVDALERHHRLAGVGQHPAQVPHGPQHHAHQGDEGEEFPNGDRARGQERASGDQHDGDLRHAEHVADAPVQPHQPVHAEIVVAERGVALAKAIDLEILPSERPHHANAGEVFLQHRRHGRFGLVHFKEDLLHPREERHRAQDDDRHQAHRQHRQQGVAPEQHRRHDREQEHGAANLHHLRRQEHAHGLHVGAAALHQVAGVGSVEERRRQMVQALIEGIAQLPGDGLRCHRRPSDRADRERALRAQ